MTVHERQKPPAGHGEVLCSPPFSTWHELVERNSAAVAGWPAPLRALREQARSETVAEAVRFSGSIGVSGESASAETPIVMTGHQPELYHPGVWVKVFLVDRLAEEIGALGLDLVVDTDAAELVALRVPCLRDEVRVCEVTLAEGGPGVAYMQTPVPTGETRAAFRESGISVLEGLPAPALRRHFSTFCDALDAAAPDATDLGTLMTAARRRYEAPAQTAYLEVLASAQSRLPSYRAFAASLLCDASRFRVVMNDALSEYRTRTGSRSAAQPFPDLAERDGRVEAPFWLLDDGRRRAVSVGSDGTLFADDEAVAALGATTDSAARALERHDLLLAPKALTLTLFQRLFVADLFVHGTGGGRYDRVTDAVIARYYTIEPPQFAIASMTLLLPLGAHVVSDEDVAEAGRRVNRFEHNPDSLLPEVEFDSAPERVEAEALAARKAEAVAAIAAPGADRKELGKTIRDLNAQLSALLEPVGQVLRESLERVRAERKASSVLTDRTYPYCLWDPREVMDKVR
ncbi:MAG: hypothetical protein Q7W51_05315 [Coriobacteriia bacterium]|nr:hypothetical protein [Coriobacteriia bacterium]